MIYRHTLMLALATGMAWLASANNGVDDSVFRGWQPIEAAKAGAPMFHFAAGSCMPEAAVWDGKQSSSVFPDDCLINKLSDGCPAQDPWKGPNTKAHDFPTYYVVRECPNDNTFRVVYDIFFPKDSGHAYDWEYVVVVWKNYDGKWYRDSIIMEQDGNHPHLTWGDIPNTFDNENDMFQDGNKYRDHPKVYVNKFHHAVYPNINNKNKGNCAVFHEDQFRMNDYYYSSADWLVDGTTIEENLSWTGPNWGGIKKVWADSFPASFWGGHMYDVCTNLVEQESIDELPTYEMVNERA